MHDRIQKFSTELNEVFLKTLSTNISSFKVSNIPWSLKEVPESMINAKMLINHLIHVINSICPIK